MPPINKHTHTVTIQSAAEILGMSVQTLRTWDKQGRLPAFRDPKTGYRLYNITQLEQFAKDSNMRRKKRLANLAQ